MRRPGGGETGDVPGRWAWGRSLRIDPPVGSTIRVSETARPAAMLLRLARSRPPSSIVWPPRGPGMARVRGVPGRVGPVVVDPGAHQPHPPFPPPEQQRSRYLHLVPAVVAVRAGARAES